MPLLHSFIQSLYSYIRTEDSDTKAMKLVSSRRCGVDDNVNSRFKRYVLHGSKMMKNDLTYRITRYSKRLSRQEVDGIFERALNVWSKYTDLKFTAAHRFPVDIEIRFEENEHYCRYPFDGLNGEMAHASSPTNACSHCSFVHFDDAENWSRDLLFHVALHEFGHTLGLQHSDAPNSVMKSHVDSSFDPNFPLDFDDIQVRFCLFIISIILYK